MTQTIETLSTLTARDLMSEACGTIQRGASLREVVERFLTGPSRHLIVVDEDGRCLGILGPRHIAQAHRFDPRGDREVPVEDLGYAPWIALRPEDGLRTCAQMLVEHELDAIPVLDAERRVLGVVTVHDIARAAADAAGHVHPHWEE
ncbi:MAG TPA: CBS domain-containing protein [Thermoleophilia bacterium]|jgi:CBS-domain-containing membrane protein|nr:CBS domain-containing protein [Thermoleophilia bacterium]